MPAAAPQQQKKVLKKKKKKRNVAAGVNADSAGDSKSVPKPAKCEQSALTSTQRRRNAIRDALTFVGISGSLSSSLAAIIMQWSDDFELGTWGGELALLYAGSQRKAAAKKFTLFVLDDSKFELEVRSASANQRDPQIHRFIKFSGKWHIDYVDEKREQRRIFSPR